MPIASFVSFALLTLVVVARPSFLPTAVNLVQQQDEFSPIYQGTVQSVLGSQISQPINYNVPTSEDNDEYGQKALLVGEQAQQSDSLIQVGQEDVPDTPFLQTSPGTTQDMSTHYDPSMTHDIMPTGIAGNSDSVASLTDITISSSTLTELPELNRNLTGHLEGPLATSRLARIRGTLQIFVLVFACLAAVTGIGCILGLSLLRHLVEVYLGKTATAWDILPRLERQALLANDPEAPKDEKELTTGTSIKGGDSDDTVTTLEDFRTNEKDVTNGPLDEDVNTGQLQDEANEIFYDTEDTLGGLRQAESMVIDITEAVPDPDELPLPTNPTPFSTPPPSPLHRPVQMREVRTLPVIRPAWSLRAANAPALGMTSSAPATPLPLPLRRKEMTMNIPGAFHLDENHQPVCHPPVATKRAYRAPVPQLDIAFALQLRPGLGLGSDPAWLVRFLMAMFGWMTILWGGTGVQPRLRRPALLG
ncbi:hypothetical protein BDY19DRAFT_994236 [Irpex rosettiformis]|uniref:Uncharacterized protein n=1 Tax=Irpex rosettiformis TaxID=378272 RepID=A0ACB8U2W6_9APHY|nr:hypothetical protein BDY19DRAFT_994236 [Irpex rosettiformis]